MSLVHPVHRYRWIIVINPSYYGLAAIAVLLLSDFESECERDGGSEFDCYTSSGDIVLANFDFDDTNPYFNIMVSERPKYSYSALVDSHFGKHVNNHCYNTVDYDGDDFVFPGDGCILQLGMLSSAIQSKETTPTPHQVSIALSQQTFIFF